MNYGYFTAPGQKVPDRDPGLYVACPVCGHILGKVPVKTISLMVDGDTRSYFYRVHRDCYDGLTADEKARLDWPIVDAVVASRKTN